LARNQQCGGRRIFVGSLVGLTMANSSQPAPPDDRSIEDHHCMIRHVSLEWTPPVPLDGGGYRVPSSAFTLRSKKHEQYLSVDLKELLRRDGLGPNHYLRPNADYGARLTARTARDCQLGATNETHPPNNPHHGGIWGLAPLARPKRETIQRALAKGSKIVWASGHQPAATV
jgi:hypothetical protein